MNSTDRSSAAIAQQVPYLRRYARALAGSQRIGDGFVTNMLAELVSGDAGFDRDLPMRVAAFKLLHQSWRKHVDADSETPPAPRHRQLMLLTSIEDFTFAEAANIVGVSSHEYDELHDRMRAEIEAISSVRVMIIEDEPVIAMDLQMIVGDIGLQVLGIADTHQRAVAMAEATKPDLILSDIQLADGSSGVNAIKDIHEKCDVPVIFITAYPEMLLTGRDTEPAFLITKPYRDDQVGAAISQALFHYQPAGEMSVCAPA